MGRKEDSRLAAAVALELIALVAFLFAVYRWWTIEYSLVHVIFLVMFLMVIAAVYVEYSPWGLNSKNPVVVIAMTLAVGSVIGGAFTRPELAPAVALTIVAAAAPGFAFVLRTEAAERDHRAVTRLLNRECLINPDALKAMEVANMRLEIRRAVEQVSKGYHRPVTGRQIRDDMEDYLGYDVPDDELERVLRYSLR